jgi:hypothetical protein
LVGTALLADAGIAIDHEAVAKSCPFAKTLNSFIVVGSIDSILWLEEQFRDAHDICISCDKGDGNGIDHFPKVISWRLKKEQKDLSACIDANGSGGKSEECAAAIGHSVKNIVMQSNSFLDRQPTVVVAGYCTVLNGNSSS